MQWYFFQVIQWCARDISSMHLPLFANSAPPCNLFHIRVKWLWKNDFEIVLVKEIKNDLAFFFRKIALKVFFSREFVLLNNVNDFANGQ